MEPEFEQKLIKLLSVHEGRKRSMYPDSKGIVTVGVGHAIFRTQDAVLLPFVVTATDDRATPSQIILGWSSVRYQDKAKPMHSWQALFLREPDIDQILAVDLVRFTEVLNKTFPDFDSYPEPGRLALYDMCFNLGSFKEFPRLVEAVLAADWHSAAEECERKPPVSKERNDDTKNLFLQCAQGLI